MVTKTKKETSTKAKATSVKKKSVAKKVEPKVENVVEVAKNNDVFTADMFFTCYFKGWKECLNFKGRTSRFELCIFLLINALIMSLIQIECCYIFSDKFLLEANLRGLSLEQIDSRIFWAEVAFYSSFFLPLLPIVSMMIRRMHDIGKLAWQGYLEPITKGIVVLSVLSYINTLLADVEYFNIMLIMDVFYVTILYSVAYYSLKFIFTTMFYNGDNEANEFGEPAFKSDYYKTYALKFIIFYYLFVATMIFFYIGLYIL